MARVPDDFEGARRWHATRLRQSYDFRIASKDQTSEDDEVKERCTHLRYW